MPAFPPRLHCLLARDNPRIGVVIRRGPSKSVCTILWNRRNDTFQLGQWMRGRIYERRSDISPDGHHMIYFAMNGRWDSDTLGSWTAIARVPYLKAVVLVGKGDCWNGGGLFTSPSRYWLNHEGWKTNEYSRFEKNDPRLQPDMDFRPDYFFGGECPQIYYHRLMRDGWKRLGTKREGVHAVFDKPAGNGVILRKLCFAEIGAPTGHGCYYDRHQLIQEGGDLLSDSGMAVGGHRRQTRGLGRRGKALRRHHHRKGTKAIKGTARLLRHEVPGDRSTVLSAAIRRVYRILPSSLSRPL